MMLVVLAVTTATVYLAEKNRRANQQQVLDAQFQSRVQSFLKIQEAYYFEAKYKNTPQLFGALRWDQQLFGTIRDEEDRAKWGNDIWRIDAALGYRFTDYLQGKLQYSFSRQETLRNGENLVAAQVTLKF